MGCEFPTGIVRGRYTTSFCHQTRLHSVSWQRNQELNLPPRGATRPVFLSPFSGENRIRSGVSSVGSLSVSS
eukprot:1415993-Rhodomonas_salina.1